MIYLMAICPCSDCGFQGELGYDFYPMLIQLEIRLGTPLFITSSGRCEKHNKFVGGSPTSKHIFEPGSQTVRAVDLNSINGSVTPTQIAYEADKMGFKGIGIYKGHVHLDMRTTGTWRSPDSLW